MSLPRQYSLVIIIILLGFGLRIHDLQAVPLRGDEAFSVLYWADTPLSISLTEIAHGEPHTPLVYAVGRLWNYVVGGIESVFALRYLPALGNIIGVPAMIALGWRLSHRVGVGLLAGLMWALHPFEIWHSQEFRNYAYWGGVSVTSMWLGLRLVDMSRRTDWFLYTLVAGFAVLTIYTESFTALALVCFALTVRHSDWKFLRRLILLLMGMGLLLVFGLYLLQVRQGFMEYYPGLVQSFSIPDYFTRFVPLLMLGSTIPLDQSSVGLVLSLVCLVAALLLQRNSARQFRFVTLTAVLPLLLLGVASQRYNLFHPRYVLSTVPGFILLLVLGSSRVAARLSHYLRVASPTLRLLLLLPWIFMALFTLDAYFNDPSFRKAPAWDELGAFLNPRVTEGDLVIQLAVDPAFGYYYNGVAEDIGLPVKPDQSADEIAATLDSISNQYESIYVVAREQAGWENTGIVEKWMQENMQQVLRTDVSGLPAQQYMKWSVSTAFQYELARFDDIAALLHYDTCSALLPTGELLLRVYWKPLSHSAQSLKSFVHVYSPDNSASGSQLSTQDDQFPQDGRLDTTSWPLHEVFREIYYLPARSLSEGTYDIRIGWYDPVSARRLSLADGTDSFLLCSLELSESSGAAK